MKVFSQLLALAAFYPIATAFSAWGPEGRAYGNTRYDQRVGERPYYDYSFPRVAERDRYDGYGYREPQLLNNGLRQPISDQGYLANGVRRPYSNLNVRSMENIANLWDTVNPVAVQGGSLRTWSFASTAIERVQVMLKTEGRPLRAKVELWQGPDNTPSVMEIYNEDGYLRPFNAVIETPGGQNSIAIRNTGQMEFPFYAGLVADVGDRTGRTTLGLGGLIRSLYDYGEPKTVQGGALVTYPFDSMVGSVQIMLMTDGRPLNARIELLQGPNNNKQTIDLHCQDGQERPFFAVVDTPGTGNVIRIVNTSTMEFPLVARVEPYSMERVNPEIVQNNGQFITERQY